jgi:hypothetical protein
LRVSSAKSKENAHLAEPKVPKAFRISIPHGATMFFIRWEYIAYTSQFAPVKHAAPYTQEGDRLEVLTTPIEADEKKHYVIPRLVRPVRPGSHPKQNSTSKTALANNPGPTYNAARNSATVWTMMELTSLVQSFTTGARWLAPALTVTQSGTLYVIKASFSSE